jgi:hypothetical protein
MKTCDPFFLHLGRYRVKTAVGKYHIPQVLGLLHDLGVEHGVIAPEIAAEHGVLPEGVDIPVPEPAAPVPPTLEDLAKEEVLSLLKDTSPVSPAPSPASPAEGKEPEARPEPPTKQPEDQKAAKT